MTTSQTIFFAHCWAVFEGGGVRGAAHAGAYSAARKHGVQFSRVAGTSAGSIVAALIAAGAEPDYVSTKLEELDFRSFISEKSSSKPTLRLAPWWLRIASSLLWGEPRVWANIVHTTGIYSSDSIQNWIEACLRELLASKLKPGHNGPILFSDLKLPLHVVATDLTTGSAKIWSAELTPRDSVAFAVRCSCNIPFFYRAVESEANLYVDGGVVSNLPSYLFTSESSKKLDKSGLTRILAFRLIQNVTIDQRPRKFKDFVARFGNAVVNGATEVQQSLQSDVYDIPINTGVINSTDFDKIGEKEKAELHFAGESAVKEFLINERSKVRHDLSTSVCKGFDEKMLLLTQAIQSCKRTICSSGKSTYWLDFSFPVILSAVQRGVFIRCITIVPNCADEARRHSLLRKLGAKIHYVNNETEIFPNGFLIDECIDSGIAITSTESKVIRDDHDYGEEIIRVYSSSNDRAVMSIMQRGLANYAYPSKIECSKFDIIECTTEELFDLLRNVPQYANANFKIKSLNLNDEVRAMLNTIKEYKLLQIKELTRKFLVDDASSFKLRKIRFADGSESIITPPVVEKIGDKYVVIDGNTRLYYYASQNLTAAVVIVVENVTDALPSTGLRQLNLLRLTSSTVPLSENYENLNRSLFRKIEEAVHFFEYDSESTAVLSEQED